MQVRSLPLTQLRRAAMGHYPAGDHPPGTKRLVYNEDSGAFAGWIPEAAHTYNALAYHGGMNEHQLAISETTFGGLGSLGGQEGLIDYGTLMDLALQVWPAFPRRCKILLSTDSKLWL